MDLEKVQFFNIDTNHIETLETLLVKDKIVIDFWHSKCTKCPAALEKLNEISNKYNNVKFYACALSLEEGDVDLITDIIDDSWENLTNLYLTIDGKEQIKKIFDFNSVPFSVIISKDGTILNKGDPKNIQFDDILNIPTESNNQDSNYEVNEDF